MVIIRKSNQHRGRMALIGWLTMFAAAANSRSLLGTVNISMDDSAPPGANGQISGDTVQRLPDAPIAPVTSDDHAVAVFDQVPPPLRSEQDVEPTQSSQAMPALWAQSSVPGGQHGWEALPCISSINLSVDLPSRGLDSSRETYVVNTTANFTTNPDEVTLRDAIASANGTGGLIVFAIPGPPPHMIQPTVLWPLPTITGNGITIDGNSEIQINGASSASGSSCFSISGHNNAINGVDICCYSRAIQIVGGSYNTITNCRLGAGNSIGIEIVDAADNTIGPGNQSSSNSTIGLILRGAGTVSNQVTACEFSWNGNSGVRVMEGASSNRIGPGNVVGLNGWGGIDLFGAGSFNEIDGNWVGTNQASGVGLGNANDGILVAYSGTAAIHDNVVSGNGWCGIDVVGSGSDSNAIYANVVGTDAAGAQPLPNGQHGVLLRSGPRFNTVGPGNLISGNTWSGVAIYANGTTTRANTVSANFIGLNTSRSMAIPNSNHGLALFLGTTENTLGPGNVVAGNLLQGISIGGADTWSNDVFNNEIGIVGVGNQQYGCRINTEAKDNDIGPGNKICGNHAGGILVEHFNTSANRIKGNEIGGETPAHGNSGPGVTIRDAASLNIVGESFFGTGSETGEPNLIANNQGSGVLVLDGSRRNTIRKNSIHANTEAGIRVELQTFDTLPPDILPLIPQDYQLVKGYTAAPVDSIVDFYVTPDVTDQGKIYVTSVSVMESQVSDVYNFFSHFIDVGDQKLTATVTSTDRTTSAFGGRHSRRVIFPNEKPIKNAKVYAYHVVGDEIIKLGPSFECDDAVNNCTDENGHYRRPPEFDLRDARQAPYVDMQLGVLAEVHYTDRGLNEVEPAAFVIVNYPSDDPFKPLQVPVSGYEDIVFPYPLILHAGLNDGVKGWSTLGPYFRADAGDKTYFDAASIPEGLRKAPSRLPAFMTFTMPSGPPHPVIPTWLSGADNNNVPWGYSNDYPWSEQAHDENARRLNSFIGIEVRNELVANVMDADSWPELRLNMCVHSMGGTISRAWRSIYSGKEDTPAIAGYVSLDGVHGGTTLSQRTQLTANVQSPLAVFGFAEWWMNGWNMLPNEPPVRRGWNYFRETGTSTGNLLYTATAIDSVVGLPMHVVDPNCSALGVGRTMMPINVDFPDWLPGLDALLELYLGGYIVPNGHRARFIGGWEVYRPDTHSHPETGINRQNEVAFEATGFLAKGDRPTGAQYSGPAELCQAQGTSSPGSRTDLDIPGQLELRLSLGAGQTVDVPVDFDVNPSIDLSMMINSSGAAFDLLGPSGQSLVPPDGVGGDETGTYLAAFSIPAPQPGVATLRLTTSDFPATAMVGFAFHNQRKLALGIPRDPLLSGEPALLAALLVDENGNLLTGTDSWATASVTDPKNVETEVALVDDGSGVDDFAGDGVFTGQFTSTLLGGRYQVLAQAITVLGSETVHRSEKGLFVVNSMPASLEAVADERAVDQNGDGLTDALEFDVEVLASQVGRYQVRAVLEDVFASEISEIHDFIDAPGNGSGHIVTFMVSADTLQAHGVPGPWTLARIELIDDDQILVVDTLPDYQTTAYNLSAFAAPEAPRVTRALPDYGPLPGGNRIILQGQNLALATAVWFGEANVGAFEILDGNTMAVTVPRPSVCSSAVKVDVHVDTAWERTTLADAYTYFSMPSGDTDADCDVDLVDYLMFPACLSGPLQAPGFVSPPSECLAVFDIDRDTDVDLADYGVFQVALRGAEGDCDANGLIDLTDLQSLPSCLLGPNFAVSHACVCLDLDRDGDMDLADFAEWQVLFTGL